MAEQPRARLIALVRECGADDAGAAWIGRQGSEPGKS